MSVSYGSDIAPVAALLADRTRAAMLTALLDGRPLAAGELARAAGVGAATASAHLAKLLAGDLVTVISQGRHRYYRLKGAEVAAVIEALSVISPSVEVRGLRQSRQASCLREARTCYDHLAGRVAAALFAAMLDQRLLEPVERVERVEPVEGKRGGPVPDGPVPAGPARAGSESGGPAGGAYDVTLGGERRLAMVGVDVASLRRARRRFAGHCLDWTERRPHLSGALGAALAGRLIADGWFERTAVRRALVVTEKGRAGLAEVFGCVLAPGA